jgi:hypothetical protein
VTIKVYVKKLDLSTLETDVELYCAINGCCNVRIGPTKSYWTNLSASCY